MEASPGQSTSIRFGKISGLGARLASSIQAAQKFLFARQHEDGWWCGELEADTTLESDYIFLHTVLGTRNERRFQQCAEEILRHQNEDGGWPIYQGGPSNVTAAVKAYFALKMCGYLPEEPRMARARERILAMGGVPACNTFSKIYLLRPRTIRLRRGSGYSPGDCALSQLVLVQYLRDLFVVARDFDSAFHLLREKAVQKDS